MTFDKVSFLPDKAIGRPFGSIFEISHGQLIHIPEGEGVVKGEELIESEYSEDNRKIIDDGTAQRLSHEDIHEMKKQGISGQVREDVIVCIFSLCLFLSLR